MISRALLLILGVGLARTVHTSAFAEQDGAPANTLSTYEASGLAGPTLGNAEANVPEVLAEGYQLVYEVNIPVRAAYRGAAHVTYVVDRRSEVQGFDRVAYFLELTDARGTRWVYVSMDAFTHSIGEIAIPHDRDNPVLFQRPVRNMNVLSNDPKIKPGSQLPSGWIEMWPTDYAANNSAYVPKASDQLYDFGDSWVSNGGGYGSFQVHDVQAQQTLLAWNHWGTGDGTGSDDIGIGNAATGQRDYTFAANGHLYTVRTLLILIRPTPYAIEWKSVPADLQLYPRDRDLNRADVELSGVETAGGFDAAVLRVRGRDGGNLTETDQSLVYVGGRASFAFHHALPAELRGYDYELFLRRGTNLWLAHNAENVVAGDVLILQGQSNADAAMYGGSANGYRHPFVRTFGQNSADPWLAGAANDWRIPSGDGSNEVPGGIGQWGLVMANKLASTNGIPIAIMNGAHGGQPISFFQRNDPRQEDLNTNYGRLLRRMRQARLDKGVRAILFYQGESDVDAGLVHENGYRALRADWEQDYPDVQRFYIHQVREGCLVSRGSVDLRNRQRLLADSLPNTGLMSGNGLDNHDGCHYQFVGGYEKIGGNFFRMLGRDLYGSGETLNVDPPNPARAEFTSAAHNEIRIILRNTTDPVTFDSRASLDFFLEGSPAIVRSGRMQGNHVLLRLDRNAVGARAVAYNGHTGSGAWVKNGNAVGLVCFSEPIVDGYPVVQILAPAGSIEAQPGIPVSLGAYATMKGRQIQSLELLLNGVIYAQNEGQSNLTASWTPVTTGAFQLTARAVTEDGLSGVSDSLSVLVRDPAASAEVAEGLRVWLRAEKGIVTDASGRVSQWQDQSGNGFHAAQPGSGSRPVREEGVFGCLPGIRFVTGQWMASSSGMPTNSYTKVVRYKLAVTNLANHLLSAGDSSLGAHQLFHANSLFPRMSHGSVFATSSVPSSLELETVLMATYESLSHEGRLYLNGHEVASGVASLNNASLSWVIGGSRTLGQLNGWLAEVMIYDRVLTVEEREAGFTSILGRCRTPYQLWWQSHRLADGDPASDADGDGVPLGLEYSLGLNPTLRDAIPVAERLSPDPLMPGRFLFQLDRPRGFVHVEYRVGFSVDLESWLSAGVPEVVPSPRGQEFERLRWVLPERDRQFVRLGVTTP